VKAFNAGEVSFKDVVTFNMVRPIARKLKSASFLTNEG
jgi:hypothetical protein